MTTARALVVAEARTILNRPLEFGNEFQIKVLRIMQLYEEAKPLKSYLDDRESLDDMTAEELSSFIQDCES